MALFIKKINRSSGVLLLAWLAVQVGMLLYKGITTDIEAQVYINIANHLLTQGSYEAPKSAFYSIPIWVIALCIKTGIGYWGVVAIQVLANGLATICFYKICRLLAGCGRAAFVSTLLLITFLPLQIWNTFLYTDSLFISLSIIFSYGLLRTKPDFAGILWILFGLVVLLLTRPLGILFVVPTFIYLLQLLIKPPYALVKRLGIIIVSGLIVLFFVNMVYQHGGGDLDMMKPNIEEHIICFVLTAQPAANLALAKDGGPLYQLVYYISNNPTHFIGLFVKRLWAFINLSRPYYSTAHNLLLYAAMLPIYLFALLGFIKRKKKSGHLYLLLLILVYAAAIALQCDDYHSRFVMVVVPYVLYLAGVGVVGLVKKWDI